jgi:peptide/nickel transport system substrate-binding protein
MTVPRTRCSVTRNVTLNPYRWGSIGNLIGLSKFGSALKKPLTKLAATAVLAGSLAASLVITLSGCSSNTTAAFVPGTQLVVGEQAPLQNLNSAVAADSAATRVSQELAYLTMPAFFGYDANGNPVANEGFGSVELGSGNTVVYKLTGKAKWTDGQPVTGEDLNLSVVAATNPFDSVALSGFQSNLQFTSLAGAKATSVSKTGLTLKYSKVPADWQTNLPITAAAHLVDPTHSLATASAAPSAEIAANYSAQTAFSIDGNSQKVESKYLVSAGAYKIAKASAGSVSLVHNSDFDWGPAATIDKLTIKFFNSGSALLSAVKSGQVDIAAPVETTGTSWAQIQDAVKAAPGNATSGIGPNNEVVLLNHGAGGAFAASTYNGDMTKAKLLSAAFQHFIPRAGIYSTLLSGSALNKTDSFVFGYGSSDYSASTQQNGTAALQFQNAELTQELWQKAGFARTIKVRVLFDAANPRAQLEYSQLAQWGKVSGFTIQNVSADNVNTVLQSGGWDVYIAALPRLGLSVGSIAGVAGALTHIDDSKINALTGKLAKTLATAKSPDLAKQANTLSALDKQLVAGFAGLPVFELPGTVYTSKRASAFKPSMAQQFATWGYPYWSVSASAK